MKIVEILPQEGLKLFLRYEDGIAGVVDLSYAGRQRYFCFVARTRDLREGEAK